MSKIEKYIKAQGIPVHQDKINRVEVRVDDDCNMAEVLVNGKIIMMGNFWDFHPGCHGFDLKFNSYTGLADLFVDYFKKEGFDFSIEEESYEFE